MTFLLSIQETDVFTNSIFSSSDKTMLNELFGKRNFLVILQILDIVKLRSGLVQVWFRLHLKFNSLELDSEVGRLVVVKDTLQSTS